jgi:hypothetical protein
MLKVTEDHDLGPCVWTRRQEGVGLQDWLQEYRNIEKCSLFHSVKAAVEMFAAPIVYDKLVG